ncbi:MAG: hypothetical protein ACLSA6_09260 [Holdemania massiliensis]
MSEGKFFGENYLGFERLNLAVRVLSCRPFENRKMVLAHQK